MLTRSLVVLSLTAALLAGCGDDEPTASTPAALAPAATTPAEQAGPAQQPAAEEKSDEKKSSKKDDAKTKAAWVVAVNKRCKEYSKQSTAKLRAFSESGNTSPAAATEAMESVIPLGKQMVNDLRKIDAEDAQGEFTEFLDTMDSAFTLMPEITKSLASGKQDPKLMEKLAEIEKKTRPFASEYGLDQCLNAGG